MATTTYRLAEEILKFISGGDISAATNVSINEIKIAIGQVCNSLLKVDYMQVNGAIRETIPNGTVLGLYENIQVTKYGNKSAAALPIKPIKLPRNMGVWSVFPSGSPDSEFIPLQMGQFSLLKSQPLLNDLLGQCGYEVYGNQVLFTKDLTKEGTPAYVSMRLAIMDISQYGDFDILPILPEMEWAIKKEVIALFVTEGIADKLVDATDKQEKNIPVKEQQQP